MPGLDSHVTGSCSAPALVSGNVPVLTSMHMNWVFCPAPAVMWESETGACDKEHTDNLVNPATGLGFVGLTDLWWEVKCCPFLIRCFRSAAAAASTVRRRLLACEQNGDKLWTHFWPRSYDLVGFSSWLQLISDSVLHLSTTVWLRQTD